MGNQRSKELSFMLHCFLGYFTLVSGAGHADFTGNVGLAYAGHASSIKRSLLTNYDKTTPGTNSDRVVAASNSMAGTDVYIQFRFFKVVAVSSRDGTLDMKVWYRSKWKDERLSWNSSMFGDVTYVTMFASTLASPELSEIWVPDVQLYNSLESTQELGANALAMVYSDGTVYWSRPGMLRPLCKYSGLVAFPFDTLRCDMEFAGWSWSGYHQGIFPRDGKYASFSDAEATSGSSYQEFDLIRTEESDSVLEYDCCPGEPWPVVRIAVFLKRAETYYGFKMFLPYFPLAFTSLMATFTSPKAGERLGFGITVILVVVVSDLVFIEYLPVCKELLWFYVFHEFSLIFCCLSLIESCIVLFLSFHDSETLMPDWLLNLFGDPSNASFNIRSGAGQAFSINPEDSDVRSIGSPPRMMGTDVSRLIKFEYIFDVLDKNDDEVINLDEVRAWLSYAAMHLEEHMRELHLTQNALDMTAFASGKGFVRDNFIMMCIGALCDVPLAELSVSTDNYCERLKSLTERNLLHWGEVGKSVDLHARVVMPIVYVFGILGVFSIQLEDDYAVGGSEVSTSLHPESALRFVIALLVFVLVACLGLKLRSRAKTRHQRVLKAKAAQVAESRRSFRGSSGGSTSILDFLAEAPVIADASVEEVHPSQTHLGALVDAAEVERQSENLELRFSTARNGSKRSI